VLCTHVRTKRCFSVLVYLLHCGLLTDTQEALRAAFPEVDAACEIAAERAAIAQHMLRAITAATASSAGAASTSAGHSRGASGGYYSRYTDSTALAYG
jgi:deferrochelatase/peroxidase EfeB